MFLPLFIHLFLLLHIRAKVCDVTTHLYSFVIRVTTVSIYIRHCPHPMILERVMFFVNHIRFQQQVLSFIAL